MAKVNKLLIKLSKPCTFENKEYSEVDLDKLNDLTFNDLQMLERTFEMSESAPMPEFSLNYCINAAALATKIPVEFFHSLNVKDVVKIRATVSDFFLS